jgi:hypothetical protein
MMASRKPKRSIKHQKQAEQRSRNTLGILDFVLDFYRRTFMRVLCGLAFLQ